MSAPYSYAAQHRLAPLTNFLSLAPATHAKVASDNSAIVTSNHTLRRFRSFDSDTTGQRFLKLGAGEGDWSAPLTTFLFLAPATHAKVASDNSAIVTPNDNMSRSSSFASDTSEMSEGAKAQRFLKLGAGQGDWSEDAIIE